MDKRFDQLVAEWMRAHPRAAMPMSVIFDTIIKTGEHTMRVRRNHNNFVFVVKFIDDSVIEFAADEFDTDWC